MAVTRREAPTDCVLRAQNAGVVTLTLNRPARYNALSGEMLAQLRKHLDRLVEDRSARILVIASGGPAFCPGHDLREMQALHDGDAVAALLADCCEVMLGLSRLPQVVIARVQGIATAAGCQLVAACDLAVAASTARFATSGIDYGLFCSTPAVPISRVLGRKRALEMLLTGEFIDARTALDWGLVNRVVPDDQLDQALAQMCSTLLAKPPVALSEGKRFFHRQLGMDTAPAYREAAALLIRHVLAQEGREGMSAFAEKRAPRWPPPA